MNVADNHRISSIITIFFYVTSWITQSVSGQALFGRNSPSNFMFVSPSRYGASNPNAPSGKIIHKSSLPAKNQVQYAGAGASLKPGYCPSVVLITSTKCADLCGDDNDCVGMKKCCRNGCGKRCIEPVHQAQNPPSQQQAQNAPQQQQAQNAPPQQQVQNAPPQQQVQNAPPQQQVQNAPPQQQVQNAPPQQQAQNHPSNRQTQNAPTEHQPIINNKPDLFPGVPPSQLYGANHLPNTVNGGPMFHRPNSSAPQSEAVYNQRNQPNIAGPNNFYQQQHTGTNDPQGNVPSNGSVGSFYPPSTPTNGQHQINEIQGHSYIPQGTINSHAPAANNPWTSNAQSPSYPGHIAGQAPVYDPASHTIQGGASNSQHRNIQMGVSQNQTAGYDLHQNLPSGSNPPYQYNGLPNGNGQPNLNNPPPYSAPNGPNNPSPETYDQVSGLYNQQFPQPSSYNPSQPYHAATGGSSYRPAVPNNQYSNPAGGPNSDPYQQQVSGGTNVHNFTTEYSGGAYDPSVQQRHQQQHTERANGESVSHVEYPMGAHQKEGESNSQFYDPVGKTGPDGNLYEPHPNTPGQNQFIQGPNQSEPYQNIHSRFPNRPTVNQNEPLQNGFGQNYNGPYRNEPSRNQIGPYQNGANQNPSGPYQNGQNHNPSGPYQNRPSQNPSGPYQNGANQNPSGPYQNGPSESPSEPYQNVPSQNPSGPYQNGPSQNPSGPYQNGANQNPSGPYQNGANQNPSGPYQNGPSESPSEPYQIVPSQNPSGPYQNGPSENPSGPYQNGANQNPSGPYQNGANQNPSGPYQNGPSESPSEPYQNVPSQNPSGPYQNVPSQNPSGPYQNGANQNPSGPYQNGPSESPSEPYQNVPSQNPSGPYQNGPSQNPSGPYQNGPSQNPSGPYPNKPIQNPIGPYQNRPAQNKPNINNAVLNTNGPYQNTHMQNPNGYPQSGPIPNQKGPQQIRPRNNLNEAYQNGHRPFSNRPNQDAHNPYSSEPYQNKPSENYNSPRGHENGPLQNGPGQNQNGQSLQSISPHHIQTPNSVPNLPGQEGLPNSPYNEPRRSEPHHKPQHTENTRNTQYNSAGAVYPHQQIAYQKAQRSNNVLQIRPYKVGKGNSVVEILPYDGESRVPLVNGNTQNYNQDQYHHEQINQEPTNAVQYPQNGADNSLYSPNTGPPENMIQQVGEPEGIQQVQPEVRDMIPNSAVKLKPSIYGSYKIIPYDMRKYGKSKPMRSNLSGQGMGSNMNSNAPTEVKAPETIPKPASGVGPWPVGYEVTSRVHPGNSVQNQAFNTRQPRTYSNVEPKIPVEIKQTNQHQQENRGFNARTTAGIAPRWFSDNTVSYQGPKDIHTAGPEFPVPVVDKRVTYPEVESLATIKHPSSSSKNKEVSPKWDRKGKESSPQISPIPVQNALSTPAVEPKVGPREPESITKSPSFTNMVHTNGEPSSNNYNNLKQGQKEQTSIEPAGIVRDPGVNQKGDVTPGPSIKPSSNVAKNSFHDPHMDMNPMNSITYKDTRFGKNYYDPVTDHATLQEVNHHNHFESVHSRTRSQNKFSLMGGDPNPAGHVYNAAPPLQYNAANLGIVDYGQPRASAFEAQPVRRERMGLSARGDSSYGSGLSISRIYHDVGHSRAIMEPPTSFEFSSEFRKATAKPTYRPPIDSLGQVYIDIARFPDNPMQAPPNPLSLSSGFRGHIPDLLTTLPPLDKSTPKETPISYIEKKTTDAVSSLNLLEPPKTEKPAEPKNIIPEGMALTETGSKPKQMAPGSASQSSPSAPRLGISSTLIGAPPTNTGPEKKVFNRDGFNLFNGYKPQYKVPVKEIRNPSVRGAPVFSARAGKTLKKQ